MKPDADIPVEPLSDETWQRVEQGLFAKLELKPAPPAQPKRVTPRWKWTVMGLAACLPLVAIVVLLVRSESPDAAVDSQRIRTAGDARELQLGDVSVHLDPNSELVSVSSGEHGAAVVLERGAARFSVPPRGEREAFEVLAGDARVEVVGTQFRVARTGDSARVEVSEGTVRVTQGERSELVSAGKQWSASAPPAAPPAKEVEPAAEPAGASSEESAPAQARDDKQRKRFEQAAARERTAPRQALQQYEAMAKQSGPWASNALYALGRLEVELKDYAKAGKHLESYLERYPSGPNAADARSLLERIATERNRKP